ncbi:RHS repeat-associated core domain-containing protein [Algiphilus sp. W345]|uniref:RHS repeat-associated core domain-containing protein n=1 Tax=Banduia mediterranea TaxID=3075609 RepID=A0ABU2WMC4_9GAMM|nr:RHS repeat-associated core domain-containing protein [Algiphilus sp. W345]MDT0499025.1 RHS repeat-associated core domain-containing protein [Algiphilus sp. W345]
MSATILSGSKKRVTDAEGNETTITYQAYGEPDESLPTKIEAPEDQTTLINRNIFGLITTVTQSGTYNGSTVSATQSWAYDSYKRLCRKTEPETGSIVFGYDAASQIVWEAKGQSGSGCVSSPPSDATHFVYDGRGRTSLIGHPGSAYDITLDYDDAGNLELVSNPTATWNYAYNNRNLPEFETAQIDGHTFSIDHVYNGLAQLSSQALPSGRSINYAPDAWGRPTKLGSYVTGVNYHPNGLLSAYNYANGLGFSQTLNERQWPKRQQTQTSGALVFQDLEYDYNDSADLIGIIDHTDGADSVTITDMGYDGLHRLTSASGVWGTHGYVYDPLNNIRGRTGSIPLNYSYNTSKNRVSNISGSQSRSYSYDSRGRVESDGQHSYTWTPTDRIETIPGKASYGYDGNGKRIKIEKADGTVEYNLYDLAGELVYVNKIEPDPLALARSGTLVDAEPAQGLAYLPDVATPQYALGAEAETLLRGTIGDYSLGGIRTSPSPPGKLFTVVLDPPRIPDGLSPGSASSPGPTQSSTTVNFSWNASSGTVDYRINIVNEDTGSLVINDSPASNAYQASFDDDTHYSWRVRACGPVACSGFSDPAYFVTPPTPPAVPANPTPGNTSAPGPTTASSTVTVSWSVSSGATHYTVQAFNNATGATAIDTSTAGTSTSLSLGSGTTYRWHVQACNAGGCSIYTANRYFTTPAAATPPPVPANLTPGSTSAPGPSTGGTTLTLDWSNSSGATSYTVKVINQDSGATVLSTSTSSSSHSVTLDDDTSYKWRVRACNAVGCSAYAAYRYFVTPADLAPPPEPGNPSPGSSSAPGPTTANPDVTLNWSAATGAASYTVQVTNRGTSALVVNLSTATTSYLAELDYATAYRWTVKACNAAGCSATTANRYFETPPVPTIESEIEYLSLGGQTLVELVKVGGSNSVTYLHPDLLGSPRRASDSGANQQWREHYDPYGMKLNGVDEKIGYTGHAYDAETGLTYMQARFYDPLVGRFLSTDPVGFDAGNPYGFNRYSYANNNPYRYTDPMVSLFFSSEEQSAAQQLVF